MVVLMAAFLLMISLQAASQNKELTFLQNSVENYTKNNLQEKLYVHTDKNLYVANEICWFKIYNVDAIFNKPLNISKVAYVELIDNNKAVWQEKIVLNEGTGNGSILIPTSITTGNYTLRAYTNWMKNFDASFFFEKKISILNPSLTQENNYSPSKENYSIQIFPEGGNLVAGQLAKVAFKITNQFGKGIQAKGYVINDKGDTITQCNTSSLGIGSMGMGSFTFIPQTNQGYRLALTTNDDKIINQTLPNVFEKGYTLSLGNSAADTSSTINVSIAGLQLENTSVYLLVHSRGIVSHTIAGKIINGSCSFTIDKSRLNEGINIFTLFNQSQEPVCERLYFSYPKNILETSLELESPLLEKRRKVNLQIATKQGLNGFTAANASMAVYKIDSIQTLDENNIQNYIWLNSDLVGKIENPGAYFQNVNNNNTLLAMDQLMLVNGYRRFKWENVLANASPSFKYLPELAGSIITGKMVQKGSTTPVKDITGFISMPSKNTLFKAGISDENGNIKFEFPQLYNDGQLILQADSSKYYAHKIEIENPFYTSKNNSQLIEPIMLPKLNKELVQQLNSSIEIQNHFKADYLNRFQAPSLDSNAFYYKPDYTYYLDLYARFTTMEEVIREYVTPITLTKNQGRFQLAVYDDQNKRFFDKAPLVLLDGVPILNMDKFIEYDPLKIRKLEVVSRTYFLGNMAFNGIANFITYNGKMEGYELDPRATLIDYKGLQIQREFMAPVYENQAQIDNRSPDFRHLLHWSANINTSSKGKIKTSFYTSDVAGKYAIVLQGISKQGQPLYKEITFSVK